MGIQAGAELEIGSIVRAQLAAVRGTVGTFSSGDAPNGQLEVFLDEHFDNARMEHIYPNAKKVTKAE